MKKIYNTVFLLTALLLVSCGAMGNAGNSSSNTSSMQVDLENTSWQSAESVQGNIPTLSFLEGKITGNTGCNNYFSNVESDPKTGEIVIGLMSTTRMACRNMQAENNYLSMLKKVNRYKVEGNILKLYQGKVLLLKFVKK